MDRWLEELTICSYLLLFDLKFNCVDPIPNEVDDRSIFIGNVDYSTTAEELHRLFSAFGEINRITIRCNRAGHPIGCAYLEYATKESASASLALDETNFKGRELQVCNSPFLCF